VQAAGELSIADARPILLNLLDDEDDDGITEAAIWSLSEIGGEDVRVYLENLLDQLGDEDEEQIEFLQDALDNLTFTEDLEKFDLLALDADYDFLEDEKKDDV
jgi:HEAT repeat protein